MFEIFLSSSNIQIDTPELRHKEFFKDISFNIFEYKAKGIHLKCFYKHQDDIKKYTCENENYFLLIHGRVNLRYPEKRLTQLTACEVLELSQKENWYKNIKGEFTIFLYNKNNSHITVINDHFALKPVYYTVFNAEFYVSSNLNFLRSLNIPYDSEGILEKLVFTYPLENRSFLKDVKILEPGEEITYDTKAISSRYNFNLYNFIFKGSDKKFEITEFIERFNHSTLQRANLSPDFAAAITGGLDGRSVISALLKNNYKFKSYSFGKKGGENTEVPLNIKKQLGIDYDPIYLGDDYEKHYTECAFKVFYFSDGMSLNERANFIYAFSKLSQNFDTVLTGLIGGEILRPIHLKDDFLNEAVYDYIYKGQEPDIESHFKHARIYDFIDKDFIQQNKTAVEERIKEKAQKLQKIRDEEPKGYLYYLYDLIGLGFRKFFGNEVHLERYLVYSTSPFYDLDVLEYIFDTDYVEVFKNAFKSQQLQRWKGQLIYSHLFKKNCPELGKIPVDRGYPPSYLLSLPKRILIPFLVRKRKKRLRAREPEFTSNKWSQILYKHLLNVNYEPSPYFNAEKIKEHLQTATAKNYYQEFNRVNSLYLWLHKLDSITQ